MNRVPFVSIVIPTRDRPHLLKQALISLKNQSFDNFEVIVSDNYLVKCAEDVFAENADERFKYFKPDSPLSMSDNWDFACEKASGVYVGVLIDKSILYPNALEKVFQLYEKVQPDIWTWGNDIYNPVDEDKDLDYGVCHTSSVVPMPVVWKMYSPRKELQRRFSMKIRLDEEDGYYYRGKICFGLYHRDLISGIKRAAGRLFFPPNPDYTSTVSALYLSRTAVDLGQPMMISFNSKLSTGQQAMADPEFRYKYLKEEDPELKSLASRPIKNLYYSSHNSIADDYLRMKSILFPDDSSIELNKKSLIFRAKEDLSNFKTLPEDQSKIIEDCYAGLNRLDLLIYDIKNFLKARMEEYKNIFTYSKPKLTIFERIMKLRYFPRFEQQMEHVTYCLKLQSEMSESIHRAATELALHYSSMEG